jgi:hypothetical protein
MYHLLYRRILLQVLLSLTGLTGVLAQDTDPDGGLVAHVTIAPEFDAVNIENLITLTFSSRNEAPAVIYEISNTNSSGSARFLIETLITSESTGLMLRATQNPNTHLQIGAGETIRFSNLDIIRGTIPGQTEQIKFDFVLTNSGRNLISMLNNGVVTDDDRFNVEVRLTPESGNEQPGAVTVASIETSIPAEYRRIEADEQTVAELSELVPGEPLPVFRWTGPANRQYRLIITEAGEESGSVTGRLENRFNREFNPESVTDPGESILLDVVVNGTEFTIPAVIQQNVVPGSSYAWQVETEIITLRQTLNVKSDIRQFTVPEPDDVNSELIALLSELIGEEKVEQMVNEGYELQQIELGDEVYTAEEAVEILRDMLQKIRNRRATIGE